MALPPIGYQALRKGRVSEAGRLYFITKSTKERVQKEWSAEEKLAQGRLLQADVPQIVMNSLEWLQQKHLITLTAYCLMPDHLHLLFQLGEIAQLANVLRRFSSFTGLEVYRKTGRGELWSVGYHDHALRAETEIEQVVAYIENNPVKDGLVTQAQEWVWSSHNLAW